MLQLTAYDEFGQQAPLTLLHGSAEASASNTLLAWGLPASLLGAVLTGTAAGLAFRSSGASRAVMPGVWIGLGAFVLGAGAVITTALALRNDSVGGVAVGYGLR